MHLSNLLSQPLLRCVQSDTGHMSFCKLIGKFPYLRLVLIIFRSCWWPHSKDCEAWLEWQLIRRYLVAPVVVADYPALLCHPRVHIFFVGLKSWPGCILVLKQLDRKDFQFLFGGPVSWFASPYLIWKCSTRRWRTTRGAWSRMGSWGSRPTKVIGRPTPSAPRVLPSWMLRGVAGEVAVTEKAFS